MRTALAMALVGVLAGCSSADDDFAGSGGSGQNGAGGSMTASASAGSGGNGGANSSGGSAAGGSTAAAPLFVAQGHLGRTTASCDNGASWFGHQSNTDDTQCWQPPENFDCDHDSGAGRGLTYSDGWFIAMFGWGAPGAIKRSRDGEIWETTYKGGTGAGLATGQGVILAGAVFPMRSSDNGLSWEQLGAVGPADHVRRIGFADIAGGRFVVSTGETLYVSSDRGDSWWAPQVLPVACGGFMMFSGGIVGHGDDLVALTSDGSACHSSDGGDTWSITALGVEIESHLVWNGSAFVAWAGSTRYSSSDGETWDTTQTDPIGGPVGVSDDGTMIAVRGAYGDQRFIRSSDGGLTWAPISKGAFVSSHPITEIAFGQTESACE